MNHIMWECEDEECCSEFTAPSWKGEPICPACGGDAAKELGQAEVILRKHVGIGD